MLAKEKLQKHWRFILPVLALLLGLALSAGGVFAGAPTSSPAMPAAGVQVKEQPFDCSQIKKLGIDKQMNIRAQQIMAACNGVDPNILASKDTSKLNLNTLNSLAKSNPSVYGGTDADIILPEGAYPHVTQSESMVWGHANTVVVNYNDSKVASSCYAGYSYSTDGGATWIRPGGAGASPLCTGHGTNFGDPIVVYNEALNMWFIGDLATGCGGQGIGLWTSTDGMTFTAGACAHNGSSDDRESMWVDNTPSSPHFGRMYISWNDFAAGQNIYVTYSDNGTTWSTAVRVQTGGFIRNVQDSGGPDGTVFIAGMNEGGGALNPRQNIMHRSTDGGATWTSITMGPAFPAPGVAISGYFALMFPTIWRFEGWGQPAAGPNQVVHYVFTQHGSGSDAADMMYTRSTDNGTTWGTPMLLNTDTSGRPNWQGSLASTANGTLLASWYDGRESTSCGAPGANTPCYRRYGRLSRDNGATWEADDMIGDAMSPLPAQPDSTVQGTYEGDYDYSSANGQVLYTTWNDGRTLVNGTSQQDVYFDKVVGGPTFTPTRTATPCNPACTNTPTITPTRTSTPTATRCGIYTPGPAVAATIVPGTTDTGNHTDDGVTSINLPFTVHFYNDQTYTSANVSSNGNLQFVTSNVAYVNACLPQDTLGPAILPFWEDLRTDGTSCTPGPCGIYTSISGSAPNRIFNIEWRATYFTGTGSANFEIRLYEGTSEDFDFIWGPISGSTSSATIGVQDGATTNPRFTELVCNTDASQYVNKRVPMMFRGCGTPRPTNTVTATCVPGVCTPTRTITAVPTATCSSGYSYTTSTGTVVPGIDDTGNHIDDGVTQINLPFAFTFYGTPYNTANVSSNGNLQFTTQSTVYTNACLPVAAMGPAIMPFWEDLRTDGTSCTPGPCGIYTSTSGSAPNRIFNIEWRATYFTGTGSANFEIRLYEGAPSRLDIIIGTITGNNAGATVGVQDGASSFTQVACNTAVNNNTKYAFSQGGCGSATVTPIRTGTMTPIRTGTMTPVRTGTMTPVRTMTPMRTMTPGRTITPCGQCNMSILAVVNSCYMDGTVHWIAIVHNPDRCGLNAPWRAELQVRTNSGNFRTVRIQYATTYFGNGDVVLDGFFCYHFSSNVRDVRVEFLFEDQQSRSQGSNDKVQERVAPANSYSTTPSGVQVKRAHNGDSLTICDADMTSFPMAPCETGDGCSPLPTPLPTGVATRVPILPSSK